MEKENDGVGRSSEILVSNPGNEPRKLTQLIAGISVTLGALALGTVLSWTSPTDKYLDIELNNNSNTKSWVSAVMPLGAAAVVVPCGWSMDMFGRKYTMLGLAPPFVAGWLLLLFADTLWMFIVGRILTGMMGGAFSLTAPTYTAEIADNKLRGMLGGFFQLMVTIGILLDYIFDIAEADYKVLNGVFAAIPVIFFAIFLFMPETPMHYLQKGREEDARKSLQWFRGKDYDIEEELQAQKEVVEKIQQEKITFIQAFRGRAVQKGLVVSFGLMVFQQLSGINAVIFYAAPIFEDTDTLDPALGSVIVGIVQVVATLASTQIVDYLGRRILLLISDAVMCIMCVLLGVFFYLQEHEDVAGKTAEDIGWLPILSVCLFIVAFSLGYGPIPWIMVGELFPPNVKGLASPIACMLNWILAFIVTKFYGDLKDAIGAGPTFWIFAGISAVGTVFVLFFVIETKGKSLQQIQVELGGGRIEDEEAPTKSIE